MELSGANIVRGVHLIPGFQHDRTDTLLPPSIACPLHENNEDWKFYYVNMFVDRDMMMRFRGGGRVGHKSTRDATRVFLDDRDPLDEVAPELDVLDDRSEDTDFVSSDEEGDDNGLDGEEPGEDEVMDGDEGIADRGEDVELEIEEYGYSGIDQSKEVTDDEADEDDDSDEADDDLGPEDGEDDAGDDLEGFDDL
ncbi:uncharacterized protein EDB91DRAFT_1174015 [Suillus paluster]|uniref:uncharacterized protein n=1 Tax=Suillus paluster TaxID=48578 RepID=UPI001B863CA0|nr:uncharacterized protein EDB91DRAFT_1174015 [Suillus paluster]KAG1722882.1 hypothetical protein EDB91DRAFT_1174015 [Suillus paluster]